MRARLARAQPRHLGQKPSDQRPMRRRSRIKDLEVLPEQAAWPDQPRRSSSPSKTCPSTSTSTERRHRSRLDDRLLEQLPPLQSPIPAVPRRVLQGNGPCTADRKSPSLPSGVAGSLAADWIASSPRNLATACAHPRSSPGSIFCALAGSNRSDSRAAKNFAMSLSRAITERRNGSSSAGTGPANRSRAAARERRDDLLGLFARAPGSMTAHRPTVAGSTGHPWNRKPLPMHQENVFSG